MPTKTQAKKKPKDELVEFAVAHFEGTREEFENMSKPDLVDLVIELDMDFHPVEEAEYVEIEEPEETPRPKGPNPRTDLA